eukprot:7186547-Prymnesium_polylepis.2
MQCPSSSSFNRRAPGGVNQNLRIPKPEACDLPGGGGGGGEEKEWENKAKGEAEADEETRVGSQFLDHQERVKASAGGEDGGRRYKDQLDKIHNVVTNL